MHFPRRTNFSVGGSNNSCSDHLIETLEERDLTKRLANSVATLIKDDRKNPSSKILGLEGFVRKIAAQCDQHQANPRQIGLNRTGRKLRIVENSYRSASSRIAARFTGTLGPRSIPGGRTSQRLADTIRQQPWAAFVSDNGENLLQTAFSTHAQQ
jgi:hypothetical protein